MKNTLQGVSLTHISLTLVGLMWVFPFLIYHHAYPVTTFYQEWWSALLGVSALILLTDRDYWRQPDIPRIAQLPAALIGVVVLQWSLDKIAYFDQALLFVLYLLFAMLLILLGARLRDCFGITRLAQVLAIFLLVGAELSALVGVLQHFRWDTPLGAVVVMKISSSVYGNIAQPNHFANYIALGMISLGFLLHQQKLRVVHVAVLAMPLLLVMALSGSRSSWLYLLMMAGLAWWLARHDAKQSLLLRYTLWLLAGFGAMHLIVQLPFTTGAQNSVNTVQRLFSEDVSGGGVRLFLWREAMLMFMQSPWVGVGFGQFAWQHFQLLPELQPKGVHGLYNNAHSFVFQLAAETGIAGLLSLFLPLGVWFMGLRRSPLDAAHWWGYAVLGVLSIHSLLEYPLWYAYFMAIAAFLLGMLDETRYHLELRRVGRLSVVLILFLGLLSLMQLMTGYRELEQVQEIRSASKIGENTAELLHEKLVAVHTGSLLSPYAELFMANLIEVNDDHLKEKLAINSRVMHFVPISSVVYRQALLLAQADQLEQAKITVLQAIWSFPGQFDHMHKQLLLKAEKDPEHYAALLEFALQKNQEYRSGIHR